jgi:ABC-type multidrug transport system ATPase subunit
VLDGVSAEFGGGRVAVITGANGAGKSTLLRIVAGVLAPDRGYVELASDERVLRGAAMRRRMGYVPEAADPPGHLSGAELWGLVRALRGAAPLSADLRAQLGVDALADKRIERMSLGERRRTCLAAALIGDPAALVLDEPTNGLDAAGAADLETLVRERAAAGAAVIVATHDAAFAAAVGDDGWRLEAGALLPA